MKVNIKLYPNQVAKLSANQLKAGKMVGEQMRKEIIEDRVIPFDEGTLQNVQTFVDDSFANKGLIKIAHDTPYATNMYFNPQYNFQTTFNPNARGEWWEDWLRGSKRKRPVQLFAFFYNKLLKG